VTDTRCATKRRGEGPLGQLVLVGHNARALAQMDGTHPRYGGRRGSGKMRACLVPRWGGCTAFQFLPALLAGSGRTYTGGFKDGNGGLPRRFLRKRQWRIDAWPTEAKRVATGDPHFRADELHPVSGRFHCRPYQRSARSARLTLSKEKSL